MNWSLVDKEDYLLAIERSPIRNTEIKTVLKKALTDKINDRQVYTPATATRATARTAWNIYSKKVNAA